MTIRYYQWKVEEENKESDLPVQLFYEVAAEADNVLRWVQIFADGSVARNSLEIEAAHGQRWESLTDGPFMAHLEDMDMLDCTADEFETAWARGKDTPFWNVQGNRFPPFS